MKIELRDLAHCHFEDLYNQKNDSDVLAWIPGEYPLDRRTFDTKTSDALAKGQTVEQANYTIFVDGIIAGMIGQFPRDGEDRFEVGYFIGQEFWGKGVASRALVLCLKNLRELGFNHPLYGCHAADNPSSGRVLEKAGFQPEADIPFTLADGTVVMDKCWVFHFE
ncbi:GNAT family N-acetyltransferase [Temperatibacter marinus]|uniref:GNAT family N-acetyltransferase n=1 Tax=Temperatibacter marinus TaxID=1456591 RepID=A0AA52E9Z5_9PROT|nr:GNAT family N-acetyltransferase [Temperatibacter marinus]WND01427.1 GNAT family N-acetyltransferase [Temperatibacter marinus]